MGGVRKKRKRDTGQVELCLCPFLPPTTVNYHSVAHEKKKEGKKCSELIYWEMGNWELVLWHLFPLFPLLLPSSLNWHQDVQFPFFFNLALPPTRCCSQQNPKFRRKKFPFFQALFITLWGESEVVFFSSFLLFYGPLINPKSCFFYEVVDRSTLWSGGIDFYTFITRTRFEGLNADLFRSIYLGPSWEGSGTLGSTGPKSTLSSWSVILPEFQRFRSSLLADIFGVKGSNRSIHTDEIVAYGDAIQAAIPTGGTPTKAHNLLLLIDLYPTFSRYRDRRWCYD